MAGAISHHALASSQSHWCSVKNSIFEKRTGNVRLVYAKGSCGSVSRKLGLVWASSSPSSVMEPMQLPSDGNSGHTPKKSSKFNDFHLNDLVWWLLLCVCVCVFLLILEKIGRFPPFNFGFRKYGAYNKFCKSVIIMSLQVKALLY